jgi:hypothetical protein
MNQSGRVAFFLAAAASGVVALLHLCIVLVGSRGYRYFGAPDLAEAAEQGSPWPAIITLLLAILFAAGATYALSGAGRMHRLPFLRVGLLVIGLAFAARGLLVLPEVVALARGSLRYPRAVVFSAFSLFTGCCFLVGLTRGWRQLARGGSHAA